jgi:iron complex outermembrane receptor protein
MIKFTLSSTRRRCSLQLIFTGIAALWAVSGAVGAIANEPAAAADPQNTPPSAAGERGEPLQEVVVTARKRSELLLDIPESIVAVSADAIQSKGIQTLEDVGRQTPNLALNVRQDYTTNVVIRGIGAFGDVLGVGFTIDDVPNFSDQAMHVQDLDSIEILKGPQGTLYGGSSIGGEVIYHNKKPGFDWSGETFLEAGSYNTINVFAAQNLTVVPNVLALRLSGYDTQSQGFVTNNALDVPGNPIREYGVRALLLYEPTADLSALLTLRHSYLAAGANEYIPVTGVHSFVYDDPLFERTHDNRKTSGAILKLDDDFGSIRGTSITSYTRAQNDRTADVSFTPPFVPGVSVITSPGQRPNEVTSQEFRLTSPSGGAFDWLAGLYGVEIKNVLNNQSSIQFYPPPSPTILIRDFETRRVDLAAFGTANYHIGRFTLGGGVRVAKSKSRAHIFVERGGLPNQTGSITSTATLPKVTVSYALPNAGLIYANVAAGEEPGSINAMSTAPRPFQAEKAISYEVGTKGQSANREVTYEIAAFYIKHTKAQVETNQIIDQELVTLINNIGDSRSYGLEAGTTWRALPDLTLGAAVGYLNARWKTAVVSGMPIDGNTPPNAPKATASLSADYSRLVGASLRFHANFDAAFKSRFWWDLQNTPGTQEPSYWIDNARIALGADNSSWEVAFRVTNLLNTKYWTEYTPNIFGGGGATNYPGCVGCTDTGSIGAPREYMIGLTFKR